MGSQYFSPGLENKSPNAVQAAEVLHRRSFGGRDLPEEEHRERFALVVDGAPEELRPWVRDKLAFSNERLILRQRLDALCEYVAPSMAGIVSDTESFVRAVKNARNDLTHQVTSGTRSDNGLRTSGFSRPVLRSLLQAVFLRKLGFDSSETAEAVTRGRAYAALAGNGGIN